jgi:hypothetical protein
LTCRVWRTGIAQSVPTASELRGPPSNLGRNA